MANVIKHKRGSGSDPSASDLILGELAIRTDNGKLFTKMDSGAIAEIAGGGSDIAINTLSSSSATGGGSATFNGSAYRFTLSSPPSVSAAQLLVSVNGVIQKPVAGTGQPSEGFSVDGNDIIFGDAPATGADFFILTFRSLGVSEPADNSVTSAKIVDGTITGTDLATNVDLVNNQKIRFGANNELQIFRSGTESLILENQGNNLNLAANRIALLRADRHTVMLLAIANGGVEIYWNNARRIETTSAGVTVTGAITGSGDLTLSGELNMTTDGNKNRFIDASLADGEALHIRSTQGGDQNHENMAQFLRNAGVQLYFDNSQKFKTLGTGISVYGSGSTFLELGSEAGAIDSVFFDTSHGSNTKPNMDFKLDGDLAMRIDPSGNVGIGTQTPAFGAGSGLEVQRAGVTTVRCDDTTHSTAIEMKAANGAAALTVPTNHPLLFETNGQERCRVDTSGILSFGKSLYGDQSSENFYRIKFNDVGGIANDVGIGQPDSSSLGFNTVSNGSIRFYQGTEGEVMRIDDTQFVGIGTSSPSNRLHVKGGAVDLTARFENSKTGDNNINYIGVGLNNTATTGIALFGHTGHSTAAFQAAWFGLGGDAVDAGVGVKAFRGGTIFMAGQLNIGNNNQPNVQARISTSSPQFGAFLETTGNTAANGIPLIVNRQADNGVMIEFKQANGVVATISRNSSNQMVYGGTSDYRLKENNVAISDSLTKVKSLKPYEFNWKDRPDTKVLGFFAHELQEVVPQAVTGTKDEMYEDDDTKPKYQNVDNSHIVPLLVAAVQELTAKVEALEAG